MKATLWGLATCLTIAVAGGLTAEGDTTHFDGTWDTTLSCSNSNGALGYSFKFSSTVKDGALHGQKGQEGKPGWLQLDGNIQPDGAAKLYVKGLVGAREFAVGHRPAGSEYGYHVEAKFSDRKGSGKRVEGRPCEAAFVRKQ